MSWNEPPRDENGRMSLQFMIFQVASSIVQRAIIPKWLYHIGIESIRNIDEAYTSFEKLMHERVVQREDQLKKLRAAGASDADIADSMKDIFGRLVSARLSDRKSSLSDSEIIGNTFVYVRPFAFSQISLL